MIRAIKILRVAGLVAAGTLAPGLACGASSVGKWMRHEVVLNRSCSGNKDEIHFDATFTHSGSGTSITMPGFYSGSGDLFKINFMPTELGRWSWTTSSPDCAALDGLSSPEHGHDLDAVPSTLVGGSTPHPGQLAMSGRKWRFSDSGFYVVPLGLRTNMYFELEADVTSVNPIAFDGSDSEFRNAADFLADGGFTFMETNLHDEEGFYLSSGVETSGSGARVDYVFAGDASAHDFDEHFWDRFQRRLDILARRGVGVEIMFWTDDGGRPKYCGPSGDTQGYGCIADGGVTEQLVIRHVVARTAAYPTIIYNHSIDYQELRSAADAQDWLTTVKALDPYDHPVSVRNKSEVGGGTDSEVPGQTYDSDGAVITAEYGDPGSKMLGEYLREPVPVIFDDSWWEESVRCIRASRRGSPGIARRGAWKNLAVGGTGAHFRGSNGCGPGEVCGTKRSERYYWLETARTGASCLESELEFYDPRTLPGVKFINEIVRDDLGAHFAGMEPEATLLTNRIAVAIGDRNEVAIFDSGDPQKILVYSIGKDDAGAAQAGADACSECGGELRINLRNGIFNGRTYSAVWIDPRSGARTLANPGTIAGGATRSFTPPSHPDDDWVLLLSYEAPAGPAEVPLASSVDSSPVASRRRIVLP